MKRVDLKKIKSKRKAKKITIEEMSNLIGYSSPNGYYYLEVGKSKFTVEKLAQVAEILDSTIDELLYEDNIAKMVNDISNENNPTLAKLS